MVCDFPKDGAEPAFPALEPAENTRRRGCPATPSCNSPSSPADKNRWESGEKGRFSGKCEGSGRGIGRLGRAAVCRFTEGRRKFRRATRRNDRPRTGRDEFQLVQGYGVEFRSASAGSNAEIRRRRIPLPFGELVLPLRGLLLATTRQLTQIATASMGSNHFRGTAAELMVAAACQLHDFPDQMRGNRVPLQQQDRHHLQNHGVCGASSLHSKPFKSSCNDLRGGGDLAFAISRND